MSVSQQTLKRITKEKAMMDKNPVREFHAEPTEDNALEWHFTMLGPPDSPYAEGLYHGRILIPHEYPFKPPDVVLLTPNGRFELDKRICLSVSSYHPEHWHPTWGVQTVLNGLREFMLTPGNNAIGAIEYPAEVRARLATESKGFVCPHCKVKVGLLWEETMKDRPSMNEMGTPKSSSAGAAPSPPDAGSPTSTGAQSGLGLEPLVLPPPVDVLPAQERGDSEAAPAPAPQPAAAAAAAAPRAADAPVAAAVPQLPPPFIRRDLHRGGLEISIPVELIDKLLLVCLSLLALLLLKKLVFDWRSAVTTCLGGVVAYVASALAAGPGDAAIAAADGGIAEIGEL